MFKSLAPATIERVAIEIDGRTFAAYKESTVAEALLEAGVLSTQTHPVTQERRGPCCLMGVCFECMVMIDGIASQSCLVTVRPGMRVTTRTPTHTLP